MRIKFINFLRTHRIILVFFNFVLRVFFKIISLFVRVNKKRIVFSSFGGRKYDDSPKSIYLEMISRKEFSDYEFIWCFVNPKEFNIEGCKKVKIDSFKFFLTLLSSKIWVSNTGMDRNLGLMRKNTIRIETWHGTPLKKICEEENSKTKQTKRKKIKIDSRTIRCAQSNYDLEIFSRVFHADKKCFVLSDLPRNDQLVKGISKNDILIIKQKLSIDLNKKVILYMPTYREFLIDDSYNIYIDIPVHFDKWKNELGDKYVLLFRSHYAINKYLKIKNDDFIIDVSNYESLNELYLISDIMISDYSSSFFDYSILNRPMFCFAYDLEEYKEKRGLYIDLHELPCKIDTSENDLLLDIKNIDYDSMSKLTEEFHKKYAPFAGNSSKKVVDEILCRISTKK